MSKIFIDARHEGNDPGDIGKHSRERDKDNILKLASRLNELLESHGDAVRI